MGLYFTSDPHFGHIKSFLWEPRGYTSWEEAGLATVKNYNEIITDNDVVFILGDIMLNNDDFGIECVRQLKGKKYLAIGNHDTDARIQKFAELNIFKEIAVGYRMRYDKYSFWCSHYPMKMGNYKEKHPTWNLSGHTHMNQIIVPEDCIYNVGLDAHNNYPVSIEQIINDIKEYRKNV